MDSEPPPPIIPPPTLRTIIPPPTQNLPIHYHTFPHVQELTDLHGSKHAERYGYFPDEGTDFLGPARHGRYDGDSRAVAAPVLAYRQYGDTFKWMLYGELCTS